MDAPLALYRRYRPDTFAQVIGQEHVTEPLRAALRSNRVHHAYLFSGPRGCGKTTSARILARALNCADGPVEEPCGACASCRELATGGPGSVDVIEIDAASHGGVNDARDLREQATFRPMRDRYKIYIIDEAHMVSKEGFNALLKIVEEPPEHIRFVFATTEPEKVIGTVRSRTHHYPFRLIPPKVLSAYLGELCTKEGVGIDPAALPLVVRAGGGSARDTLSVLDQLIGGASGGRVTHQLTAALLGFTPDALLDEVVDAFAASDGASVFSVVDKVIETGQDPRRFTEDLLRRLRDLVIISAVPDAPASGLIDVPPDQAERLVAQAARFGRHDLSRAADLVAGGLTDLKGTTAPRLLLELLCARVLLPGADDGVEGLAARLDRLEKLMSVAPGGGESAPGRPAGTGVEPEQAATRRGSEPDRPTQPTATQPVPHPVSRPRPPAPTASGAPAPDAGGLTTSDVRRLWPEIVEAVKAKRRVTWIQLSQHAQVVSLESGVLTLAFTDPGSHRNFIAGRSDGILREAVIELIGKDWKVEAILDPSARPGTEPPITVTTPAVPPPQARVESGVESGDEGPAASREPGGQQPPARRTAGSTRFRGAAREAIQPTRGQAQPGRGLVAEDKGPADDAADRDDPDLEQAMSGAELLSQRLGARVIEEIPHD